MRWSGQNTKGWLSLEIHQNSTFIFINTDLKLMFEKLRGGGGAGFALYILSYDHGELCMIEQDLSVLLEHNVLQGHQTWYIL